MTCQYDETNENCCKTEGLEVVAYLYQHEETGRTGFVDQTQISCGWEQGNPRLKVIAPLVTIASAQAAVAVANRERDAIYALMDSKGEYIKKLIAALDEWSDKTQWVQERASSGKLSVKHLGKHRADVMADHITALEAALRVAREALEENHLNCHTTVAEEKYTAALALIETTLEAKK